MGRGRVGGGGAGGADCGDGAGGAEFQSFGAESEEGGACACDRGGVRVAAASELFWVFLVGGGDAGAAWECGRGGGVCGGAVEVF